MTDRLTPAFEILLDGAAAPRALAESVISISARTHVELADAVELRLSNDGLRWTEAEDLTEGRELGVKLGYLETGLGLVATGTIIRRECEFPERGPAIVTVIGYDRRHQLKSKVHARSWTNAKDSDIARELCSAAGLTPDIDDTGAPEPYVVQTGMADLAFLRERAMRLGFSITVDRENKKLCFKNPKNAENAAKLAWGRDLLSFRPRITTAKAVQEIAVRAWDPLKKKTILAKAKPDDLASTLGAARLGAKTTEKAHGKSASLETLPAFDEEEAKAAAVATMNRALSTYVTGDGSCQGLPAILPGALVTIEKCGERVSGDYSVSSAFHHYETTGYTTYFEAIRPGTHNAPLPPPPPTKAPPPAPAGANPEDASWVEFEVRADGIAVAEGTKYVVTLPDGRKIEGVLDETRKIRVDGIKTPGDCQIELTIDEDTTLLGAD